MPQNGSVSESTASQRTTESKIPCTIWPTRISFSKLALEYLHFCEYIKLQVNPKTKCLLVMPVTSTDKDSIRWAKGDRFHDLRHPYVKHATKKYSAKAEIPNYQCLLIVWGFCFISHSTILSVMHGGLSLLVFSENTSVVAPHSSQ